MANDTNTMSFRDFKQLTDDEREFFVFQQLSKLDNLDDKFAGKWVEKGIVGFIVFVLVAVGGSVLAIIGIKSHGA